eukprot:2377374-Rhodomonas_salina.1
MVLGECKVLLHIDLGANWIGDDGAGSLVEVLWDCKRLHLPLAQGLQEAVPSAQQERGMAAEVEAKAEEKAA